MWIKLVHLLLNSSRLASKDPTTRSTHLEAMRGRKRPAFLGSRLTHYNYRPAAPLNGKYFVMKLKRFLLRYYPPGIILEYQLRDGTREMKEIDLLHLTAE